MSTEKDLIGIVNIGDVPSIFADVISANISGLLNLPSKILRPFEEPDYAFDPVRGQYDVGAILKKFEPIRFRGVYKIIGILSVDLFVPVFTHVFGEARQGGNVALVSIFRLQETLLKQKYITPQVLERTAKVALHELCHLYNLHHCETEKCLMHFSGILDDLDHTPMYFCRYCAEFFHAAAHRKIK